jgi:hypothetical protein
VTAPDEPTDNHAPSDNPAAVPDEQELERVAVPATVRRAPKFGAFITTGGLVGALLGLVLALVTSSPGAGAGYGFISFLSGDGTVRLLTALAFAVLGGFVGGALAVRADRRSAARR